MHVNHGKTKKATSKALMATKVAFILLWSGSASQGGNHDGFNRMKPVFSFIKNK